MSKATIAQLAILAAATGLFAWAAKDPDNPINSANITSAAILQPSAQQAVANLRAYGILDETIHQLVTSGEVCRVYGHQWRSGATVNYAVYYQEGAPEVRTCGLCGLQQTRGWGAWQ